MAIMRTLFFCLVALGHAHSADTTTQLTSRYLRQAYNAALMQWLNEDNYQKLETKHSATHIATWDCNSRGIWTYPPRASVPETDRLYKILEKAEIRYAGLGKNWGADYNYTSDPPQGFWPELMNGILENLGSHYNIKLKHVRKSFLNSHTLLEELDAGVSSSDEFDLTEAYYVLSGLDKDNYPRKERFAPGCASLGSETEVVVKSSSSITSMADLATIQSSQAVKIGTLSTGNFHAISPAAPRHATAEIYDSDAELVQGIKDGEVDAGVITGQLEQSLKTGIRIFKSGSITLHASFFRKDRDAEICALEPKTSAAIPRAVSAVMTTPLLILFFIYLDA